MEELTDQLDNQDNNFLCLICGCWCADVDQSHHSPNPNTSKTQNDHGISKQLNVIFVLKSILQLPNSQLCKFLKNYGNPENWVSLCAQCTQLTQEARELHLQFVEITRKLKGYQKLIVEKVKSSPDVPPGNDDESSEVNQLRNYPKMTIWKETRIFLNYFFDDLDDLSQDPIQEANKLLNKLEANLQSPTQPDPPPTPQINQDNHEDIFEDISPVSPPPPSPSSHQANQEDPSKIQTQTSTKSIRDLQNCPKCPSQFPRVTSLLRHLQTDHKLVKLPCLHSPTCKKTLAGIKQYFKHRQRHQKKEAEQLTSSPQNKNDLHKYFTSRPLNNDNLPANPNDNVSPNEVPNLPSPISHKIQDNHEDNFDNLSAAVSPPPFHVMSFPKENPRKGSPAPPIDTTPFQTILCDLCGASFKNQKGLWHHLTFVHERRPRKRTYKDTTCDVCGMVIRASRRKLHMLRKHKDKWEDDGDRSLFQCSVIGCKRSFIKKENFDKHLQNIHSEKKGNGEKGTFVCETCGMGFYFKGRLEIHELTHGNKGKMFKCDLCGKAFGMEKNLENHKKLKRCKMEERTVLEKFM